ncbi:MAG: T9SS type A sorting domain-containing protein [Candidatus Eisenbacteria bacterium]|nr:T9SS type A sorting domain-containing protein [Candidatus Eisenbacteria bacterium]
MRIRLIFAVLSILSLAAAVHAADRPRPFEDVVNDAQERGVIDREEALLSRFRFVFAPERVAPVLAVENVLPIKSLTRAVWEYEEGKAGFRASTVEEIEGYLRGDSGAGKTAAYTYDSPSGHFRLTYETIGTNAVPTEDVNPANGIPDYVEKVAIYCDSSWTREVDELGFHAPALEPGEKYSISFENMGAYGYTTSDGHGGSAIVIENNFVGFPPNDDPEGDQLGAAKVTCAHEFKHATQMNTTGGMSMGGWIELDAVWAEDVVFDESNDYYNYFGYNDGITTPALSLDDGGSGTYEDAIWQHFLCEKWGIGMGLALMNRREIEPAETVPNSYEAIIGDQGMSFQDAFAEFATWNYLTAGRANDDIPCYGEADTYPLGMVYATVDAYPHEATDVISRMSAHPYRIRSLGDLTGALRVIFDGSNFQRVTALYRRDAAYGGGWFREDIPLDSLNQADQTLALPAEQTAQLVVIVVNGKKRSDPTSYTIRFEDGTVQTGVGSAVPVALPFGLEPNRPNPFNPTTTIDFRLPAEASTSLLVYNPAGRLVRTLIGGESLPAGGHSVRWDGSDDSGRDAASGVYYYRLTSGERTETRRMVLIR